MNKLDSLDRLGPVTDEMLAGLHADQQMKMRIRAAAEGTKRQTARPVQRALVPALCCAALAVVCVGAVGLRGVSMPQATPMMTMARTAQTAQTAQIETIAAGDAAEGVAAMMLRSTQVADLGDHAKVTASVPQHTSLFAEGKGDMPLVTVDGAVYRMLTKPEALSDSLRGGAVGKVCSVTSEPSLAGSEAMKAGLSNVASEGAAVYSVSGLSSSTAVAAEVNGVLRLFQRVSYAGKGPGSQTLEDTLDVRGKVKKLELSGMGTLEGDTANVVMNVLLGNAALKSADMTAKKQSLTITLQNGLKLQLGVSGDTLTGCGGWSCPEFFDAFEAAL